MQLRVTSPDIWLYKDAVDFRKSIDGLVAIIKFELAANPTDGIFVFCNRGKDKLKVLAWHGNGFVLLYKRLEKGRFTPVGTDQNEQSVALSKEEWRALLAGLNWEQMSSWNTLAYDNCC